MEFFPMCETPPCLRAGGLQRALKPHLFEGLRQSVTGELKKIIYRWKHIVQPGMGNLVILFRV